MDKEKVKKEVKKEELERFGLGIEVLAVSGKLGTGKNYVVENLLEKYLKPKKTIEIAFADHLKVDASITYDVDIKRFLYKKDSESREILQQHGTENYRKKHGKDIWIRILHKWIQIYISRGYKRIIITDARFENEIKWILSMGGKVIKLVSPRRNEARLCEEANGDESIYEKIKNHSSETELDNIDDEEYSGILKNDYDDEDTVEEFFIKLIDDIGLEKKN